MGNRLQDIPIKTKRMMCIYYNSSGNEVVNKYRNLYNLIDIYKVIYGAIPDDLKELFNGGMTLQELLWLKSVYLDEIEYKDANYYTLRIWQCIDDKFVIERTKTSVFIDMPFEFNSEFIKNLIEYMRKSKIGLNGTEYINEIINKETNNEWIGKLEICVVEKLQYYDYSQKLVQYRQNYLNKKQKEDEKRRKEDEKRRKEKEEREKCGKINRFTDAIMNNKTWKNEFIGDISLINYLFKELNISVPARTQGVFNEKVVSIQVKVEDMMSVNYTTCGKYKMTETSHKYFLELYHKILGDT